MTQTKEQLIEYFRNLDVATLQKLQKYSQFLIIPEEDMVTNVTMSEMVTKAHSIADSVFPEWTDRSKSDFGQFLVELFALFSEKDFWYINAFANESILRKMRSYSNIFSRASAMGYQAITCKGATATFDVEFSAGDTTTYERGDIVLDVAGTKFTNDTNFLIDASDAPTTVAIVLEEGTQVVEDVNFNGYNILIRKKDIDVTSLQVIIDNVRYTQVNNFGDSGADSTHFMVLPEEDGSCSVYFGSNGFGVQPPIGKSIRINYRRCKGSDGNVSVDNATVSDSLPSREALSATMLGASVGGIYGESATSITENAPRYFSTKRAAINESTAEDILKMFPFVLKANVQAVGNEVVYRIIPTSGYLDPTDEELTLLAQGFEPYIMLGYTGVSAVNNYKNVLTVNDPLTTAMVVDVVVKRNSDLARVEAIIRQVMDDFTNPLIKADYGKAFIRSEAELSIRSLSSDVQNVVFKQRVGDTETIMEDVIISSDEIFKSIDQDSLIVRTNAI